MKTPLQIPAAWRGTELFDRDDWLHTLQPSEIAELESAVENVKALDLPIEAVTRDRFHLPRLEAVLQHVQHSLENGGGATMIRGLPVDRLDEDDARRLFWGICQHVGTPVSQSAAGDRIFSVRDEGFGKDDARTRGPNTSKRLRFHTDRCDVIGFLCLKQARSGGENFVVSSVSLFNEMLAQAPELVEVLRQPFVYKRHNVDAGNDRAYCEQPIFSLFEGHFAANFLRVLIDRANADPTLPDLTLAQCDAMDTLEALAEDPAFHVRFHQEPGDILFLNNWVTFHRRSEFTDHDDPTLRRHLLRIWLSVPNSRPLDPAFAGNYGATGPGELRGGMRPHD